ncbi:MULTISPECIES: CRISPR-associated endonuclease Cas1 [Arcobacteraceae]|uniref:CRISPR-associated endonuclease Cas1 n=2 Tax=Arcobacteraceae TaxID=2808963 RepID=A0ABX2YAL1_9BACT|nr:MULTISPECIES: CRISPR-associated endonuclease Cas1 [Arcobacteraceae]OCL82269.1 Group II intron-encoded protein LtrA [Arcobacter porcinus]OCL90770.1 Group II intron-encoded protein LtrA [Arcobacter porcinus]OCL95818.1 Group II intron-encoded protein LtrA [Aliarcobacter thereius LMG 24486]QBF16209.1 CRISPR/Cas system-associated endonuclease Cas1 [Aliarcobacter thereius LMG 24486]TLS92166.1 CRISPR-associated endonuclease Cas1 [Aliarcobacter thereius]
MFIKHLEEIFTKENLKSSYLQISSTTKGIDEVSYEEFNKELTKNLQNIIELIFNNKYSPEPLKKIEIEKENSSKKRPIALSSLKDKIIQKTLYISLNDYFDNTFSDKSYAYRKGKSTLKAVNRVVNLIQEKNHWILKTDIKDFFENINHEKLLKILERQIEDKRIIRLIALFIQTGSFKKHDFIEHNLGVHQGDILSPLLSNIYLDLMDRFLEKQNIAFVRFADDFVILTEDEKKAIEYQEQLELFLKSIDLSLNLDKTYISHIKDGFSFLGVEFVGKNRFVDNERLQKTISNIIQMSKRRTTLKEFIEELNIYLYTLKNYYLKIIIPNSTQHQLLKDAVIESTSHKVYINKENKIIITKKQFRIFLEHLKLDLLFDDVEIKDKIDLIIAKAFEQYLANKSYKETKTLVDKKKNTYAKKFANDSTIHIAQQGLFLGISKNKFVVKEYGKIQNSFAIDKVNRIILEGEGILLSTNIIKRCTQNKITIDFINRDSISYASLITNKTAVAQNINKQSKILNTDFQIELAKQFIFGKAKNQLNYIKYLNKYHKILTDNIIKIERIVNLKIKHSKTVQELMGYEGSISAIYWQSLRAIIQIPFEKRVTYGAKDIVNSSLNYAYAILYGKVQHYLVHAGLSLNISFLHSIDVNKPTLTFDMIEEFRTFIVDRTIISMLNKDIEIKLDKDGLLTKASRQLISKNIKEKLGSYTMWKKESIKVENIIQIQCYSLAKTIDDNKIPYKPFIGKF